jgi:hypothetical protein
MTIPNRYFTDLDYATAVSIAADDEMPVRSVAVPKFKRMLVSEVRNAIGVFTVDARNYANLNAAVAAMTLTSGSVVVSGAAISLTGNLTVPSNVGIIVTPGGSINQGIHPLAINGPFEAPLCRVFFGTGAVTFAAGAVKETYPEWWGAVGDGSTDSTSAIQAAINAYTRTKINVGSWKITASLTGVASGILYGDGYGSIIEQASADTGSISLANGMSVSYLHLMGSPGTGTAQVISTPYIGANYLNRTTADAEWQGARATIAHCIIENGPGDAIGAGPFQKIHDNVIMNCGNEGIINGGDYAEIWNNRISGTTSWGIDINASYNKIEGNILISCGNYAVQPDSGGIVLACHTNSAGMYGNKVINNTINGSTSTGIMLISPTGQNYSMTDILVANNTVLSTCSACAGGGGMIVVTDLSTSGNTATVIKVIGNTLDTAGSTAYGIRFWGVKDGTIAFNHITNTPNIPIYIAAGTLPAKNVLIQGNQVSEFLGNGIGTSAGVSIQIVANKISDSNNTAPYSCIKVSGDTGDVVADNEAIGDTTYGTGIYVNTGSNHITVRGNSVSTCLTAIYYCAAATASITGNDLSNGNITAFSSGGSLAGVSIKNNMGYNPVGMLAYSGGSPNVPTSGSYLQNTYGFDVEVAISGGAVTVVTLGTDSSHARDITATGGIFLVPAGTYIKLTYSVTPTWEWYGL